MIVTKSLDGTYNLRAKQVPAQELLPELVRCIDMVCKDIRDPERRLEAYNSVIKLLQMSSRSESLIPDIDS